MGATYSVGDVVAVTVPEEPPVGTIVRVFDIFDGEADRIRAPRVYARRFDDVLGWVAAGEPGASAWIDVLDEGRVEIAYVPPGA